jgi:hypothetical protein
MHAQVRTEGCPSTSRSIAGKPVPRRHGYLEGLDLVMLVRS